MTLAAVWVEERAGGNGPLCFASDSRTKPGPIEGVNKVLLFRRPDVAAVWAGDFRYAALLASHLDAVLTATEPMRDRDIDISRALGHAQESVRRHLEAAVRPAVPAFQMNRRAQLPDKTSIVVGGFSIQLGRHFVLRIDWDPHQGGTWTTSLKEADSNAVIFVGDERKRAKQVAIRARRHRRPATGWRMEPLCAIHSACGHPAMPTIGGDVQLAKVYSHGSSRAYGIYDPADSSVSVRGTRLHGRAAQA